MIDSLPSQKKHNPIKYFKGIRILLGEIWIDNNFFLIQCPTEQNFEIIASKILKTLVIGRKISKLRFISSPLVQLPNSPLI